MVKHLPTMQETQVQSRGRGDLLEKEMATYSSILAWKIPWIVEPGRLKSVGSQRIGHDRVANSNTIMRTYLHINIYVHICMLGAQSCPTLSNPIDCSLPGSSIHGIFQARVLELGAIAFSDTPPRLMEIKTNKQTKNQVGHN